MNVFYLDKNTWEWAKMHCDKHIVKMIIEYAQLMSTAHRMLDGEEYIGKVKNIMPFGAFIEFMPGKDGLLHISEIKWERLESMDGVLEEGEEIKVKLIESDKKTGKFRLSRKVLIPKPEK